MILGTRNGRLMIKAGLLGASLGVMLIGAMLNTGCRNTTTTINNNPPPAGGGGTTTNTTTTTPQPDPGKLDPLGQITKVETDTTGTGVVNGEAYEIVNENGQSKVSPAALRVELYVAGPITTTTTTTSTTPTTNTTTTTSVSPTAASTTANDRFVKRGVANLPAADVPGATQNPHGFRFDLGPADNVKPNDRVKVQVFSDDLKRFKNLGPVTVALAPAPANNNNATANTNTSANANTNGNTNTAANGNTNDTGNTNGTANQNTTSNANTTTTTNTNGNTVTVINTNQNK